MQKNQQFWEFVNNMDVLINIISTLLVSIISICSFFRIRYYSRINNYLKKWLSKETLKSLHYYVNTRAQEIDPCENDEIALNSYISTKLIPFFMNKVFKNKITNQYFIILGDSGMGKTTFMIKLFKKYNQKLYKSFKIELIPLLYDSVFHLIDSINDHSNTILLLDGLDENPQAMENYEEFIQKLLNSTETFYKIIITCRTQFFPNEKAEPYETGKINFSTNNKKNLFKKIYISPFDDRDISYFLRKRYPLFMRKKRKKAMEIVKKCPYLMVRPMLLTYIDDLIDKQRNYEYLYQIYEQLVQNWIDRENLSATALQDFTKQTALEMYKNNSIFITKEDITILCQKYNITLKNIEARSKSLLNRNGLGQYKFAHKSIYEYILAKEAWENWEFRVNHDLSNLDMVETFLNEMLERLFEYSDVSLIMNHNFSGLHVRNFIFSNNTFNAPNFNKAIFENCSFRNFNIVNAKLQKCQFINCDLTGIDIQGSNFNETQFIKCILEEAIFGNSSLQGCIISESNLRYCYIYDSLILESRFVKSDISHSNLCRINLQNNVFEKMFFIKYKDIQVNSEKLKNENRMLQKIAENVTNYIEYEEIGEIEIEQNT